MNRIALPRRGYLGAELPMDSEAFTAEGLLIDGVVPGGMAEQAGLGRGDRIVAIAGLPVRTLCELGAALRRAGAFDEIELVIVRGVETFTRTVAVVTVAREPSAIYDELTVEGARLRTIQTDAESSRGLVLAIQGIACESIDTPDSPLAKLVESLGSSSTLRFDKRGVGDSEGGPCDVTDFLTELADARAMLELATTRARGRPLFVFGHSVGGILAALIGDQPAIAGIIVYGTPVMRWLDCLVDSTRRQLELRGAAPATIARETAAIETLARVGELNGRSAAYHAQLHELDLAAAWERVTAPVLVLRGEHDWVVRADDQARIAELARGPTTIVDLPLVDHLLGAHADREASLRDYGSGVFDRAIGDAIAAWIHSTFGT